MKKDIDEKQLSELTAAAETVAGGIGILSGSSMIQILALMPGVLEQYLLKTGVIRKNIPQTLQLQWKETINQIFENCKKKLQHEYLGKIVEILGLYMQDVSYHSMNFCSIEEWIKQALEKEADENGIYITSEEALKVISFIVDEFKLVIVSYPELAGYFLLDTLEQLLKIKKENENENEDEKKKCQGC